MGQAKSRKVAATKKPSRQGHGCHQRGERGSVLPLVAAAFGLMSACGVGLTVLSDVMVARAQAQLAADAAALAGAAEGEAGAASLAEANGAGLAEFRVVSQLGGERRIMVRVQVESALGDVDAVAGAERIAVPEDED